MKVAVSITKMFEVNDTHTKSLSELREQCENGGILWYDVESEQEIWSYAILEHASK